MKPFVNPGMIAVNGLDQIGQGGDFLMEKISSDQVWQVAFVRVDQILGGFIKNQRAVFLHPPKCSIPVNVTFKAEGLRIKGIRVFLSLRNGG